ncbi:MAG: hypothetical protein R8G01_16355 [Ilumatobacteraceae bacterium]|nr:hypothetical protein [Ilumatobacteraceae bacterium]
MTKWTSIAASDVPAAPEYPVERAVSGLVEARLLSPPGYSLWLCLAEFEAGGSIEWTTPHSDDALYVLDGIVEVDDRQVGSGGAVIVEHGAAARLTVVERAKLAHFGSHTDGPALGGPLGDPGEPMNSVHVIGPEGTHVSGARENVHAVWFADGTCDHCRAQLLQVTAPPSDESRGKAHHHSQDEIILLLEGELSMGSHHFGPMSALSIPGDVRYALVGGQDGHRFVNFRRDVSWQVYARDSEPLLETALARGGRPTADGA